MQSQSRLASVALVGMVVLGLMAMNMRAAEAFQVPPVVPPIAGGAVVGTGLGVSVAGTSAGIGVGTAVAVGTGVGIVIAVGAFAAYKWWWKPGHDPNHDAPVGPSGTAWTSWSHGPEHYWLIEPKLTGSGNEWELKVGQTLCAYRLWATVRIWTGTGTGDFARLDFAGSQMIYSGSDSQRHITFTPTMAGHVPTRVSIESHSTGSCTGPDVAGDQSGESAAHHGHIGVSDLQTTQGEPTDPERRVKTTGICSDGSTLIGVSGWYREGGSSRPPTPSVTCPAETTLDQLTVITEPKVAGQGSPQQLFTYTRPSTVDSPYHECFTPTSADYPCVLEVWILQPDGSLKPCTAGGECSGWSTDPNRDTKYACRWGPHLLGLEQCYALKQAYEPATPGKLTETPLQEPEPGAAPQPQPNPTLEPGTPTQPGEGPGTQDPETGIVGDPVTVQPGEGECFPNGWGLLNPVEWVLRPIKCALRWAFVPSATTVARVQNVGTNLQTKAPFAYGATLVGWFDGLDDVGTTCFVIDFAPAWDLGAYQVIDSCQSGPVMNTLTTWRPLLTAAIYGPLLIGLGWWAWKQYAPGSTGVA